MATGQSWTDLEIINAIVTRQGEERISDLANDDTPRARVMRENYQQIKEQALTLSSWRFATTKAALNKLSTAPAGRWAAAWQLPADHLKTLFIYPPERYEIQGDKIFSNNTSAIVLDYIRYLDEGEWPPWFREYVITMGIVKTVKGITGDNPTQQQTDDAHESMINALGQDAAQQPNQEPLPNPFVDCRY